MKKIVSLVLALSMVMSMFVSAFAASKTFEDVTDPACAGAVEALVELGVIDGLPDGTYGPTKDVTRAQLAKMLVICLGLGDSVEALEGRTVFTDVADNHWATGYINAAVQSKVISGYPDGTFKPEKNVSYAEAVTMVIRALGYGNVVDTEGTWPTAYMLKAVELELLDDMNSPKSGDAASRGNVAILLWNMLRTPMWKIYEESEGNGMTSTARADVLMLNVKFPDYRYYEEAYIRAIDVADQDVTVTLSVAEYNKAKVEDIDLPRLLIGMKVSALMKDYKDAEDATFLTLTPAYEVVEGVVTKDPTATRVTIEDTEYRLDNANQKVAIDDYVVAELDGKKVLHIVTLPGNAVEVEKIKTMENQIKNEDALVIIDGEWSSRDDIEVGDVYTTFANVNGVSGTYYMATRERLEGAFESFTLENDDDAYAYVEVDGEEYRAFAKLLKAFDGEDNDNQIWPVASNEVDPLRVKEKDNKYLDQDVELVLNYLGQVVTMYFGKVNELDRDGNFYVVTSDGYWRESTSKGELKHILLVGVDGEEEAYTFAKSIDANELAAVAEGIYAAAKQTEKATFVYVKFNDDGEIKSIKVVEPTKYDDYVVGEFTKGLTDDNYFDGTPNKATSSTVVITAAPVLDDDKNVTGFEVEVSQGLDGLNRVEKGMFAYDDTTASKKAVYAFVSDDAKNDFDFGLVESTRERKGAFYVTISGTEYKVADPDENKVYENDVVPLVGKLVAFTEDDGKVTIDYTLEAKDIDNIDPNDPKLEGAAIVKKVEDEFYTLDSAIPVAGQWPNPTTDTVIDVLSEDAAELYKKFTFLKASAYVDDENNVKFEDDFEELGTGIENVSAKKGDRVVFDVNAELVVIVSGFAADDKIEDGKLVPQV